MAHKPKNLLEKHPVITTVILGVLVILATIIAGILGSIINPPAP